MQTLDPSVIDSWHAHVYFDAFSSRGGVDLARNHRTRGHTGRVDVGRFHEKPVGPHPKWSYQLAFSPANFPHVVSWLALNHGALDVFLHPNTGDELRDHRDCALWLGKSYVLNLAAFIDHLTGLRICAGGQENNKKKRRSVQEQNPMYAPFHAVEYVSRGYPTSPGKNSSGKSPSTVRITQWLSIQRAFG